MSDTKQPSEIWPAETKFAVVHEAAGLSEIDLGEYCRRKGLYLEQIATWRQSYINGQSLKNLRQKMILAIRSSTITGARRRGQLTSLPERQLLVTWLVEAIAAGARKALACQEVGLSLRALQRSIVAQELQADTRGLSRATL